MLLDRSAEILTWPVAELDPLRLSLLMQVWRVVIMIGFKPHLDGNLGREAALENEGSAFQQRWRAPPARPKAQLHRGGPTLGRSMPGRDHSRPRATVDCAGSLLARISQAAAMSARENRGRYSFATRRPQSRPPTQALQRNQGRAPPGIGLRPHDDAT
jgi:hypothetical protein